MAKFIAHRGNVDGVNLAYENDDAYLKHAYSIGYDVECDLIAHRGTLYYGHDEPQKSADLAFLQQQGVWCHAKNLEALLQLLKMRTNCFWHETDKLTITTLGHLWCYPNTFIDHPRAVWLDLIDAVIPSTIPKIYGICGDTVR
jgi:hypothetical protein